MRLEVLPTDDPRRLRIVGEVDLHTASALAERLRPVAEEPGDLILDISGMPFIDSTGIRVLLTAFHELRGHGSRLILERATEPVRQLFELLGLSNDGIFLVPRGERDG